MKFHSPKLVLVLSAVLVALLSSALIGCAGCDDAGLEDKAVISTTLARQSILFSGAVNKAEAQTFTLYNGGTFPLEISKIAIAPPPKGQPQVFKLKKAPDAPLTLKPGKENGTEVTVEFFTTVAGDFNGVLVVGSNNADNVDEKGEYRIALIHTVLSPDVQFLCGYPW